MFASEAENDLPLLFPVIKLTPIISLNKCQSFDQPILQTSNHKKMNKFYTTILFAFRNIYNAINLHFLPNHLYNFKAIPIMIVLETSK